DLDSDEVGRVVQAALAFPRPVLVADVQPGIPDHGQQDVALGDRPAEVLTEIDPKRDCVNVHEDVVTPEVGVQAVIKPTRDVLAVFSSVRDEDPGHGDYRFSAARA